MSPRDRPRFYGSSIKQRPPDHGIRMKKAGITWWGQRWIEALEHVLRGDAGRLSRGRTYARAGRAHDLVVAGGKVTARVTGSRREPYTVQIELSQFSENSWTRAIGVMANKAQFSAELLAGTMPERIDDAFEGESASLFPQRRSELVTTCSCPDQGDPCKHVAATHYLLGEALDRDPFLLFELRGRTKQQVLSELRAVRVGDSTSVDDDTANAEVPRVALDRVEPSDYDRAPEPLPALHFSFERPLNQGAVLKQLAKPSAWGDQNSPAESLAFLVTAAAEAARKLALAEAEPEPEPELEPEPETALPEPRTARVPAEPAAKRRGRPSRK